MSATSITRYVEIIKLDRIIVEPGFNCREVKADDAHVKSLVESIRAIGLQDPLHLGVFPDSKKGTFTIIDGEHRVTALQIIGVTEALCVIDTFESREQALLVNVTKNYQKKRLRTFELATAAERLKKAGYTTKQIANEIGLSETYVGSLARMVEKLIPPLLDMFRRNDSEATVADLIACASMNPTEQTTRHQQLVYGKTLGEPSTEKPEKKKDEDPAPKVLNRAKIKAFILDVINGESINIRGMPKDITDDIREAGVVLLRHVIGELKKNPVVVAPDDREDA